MRKSAPVSFLQQSLIPRRDERLVIVHERELLLLDDDGLEAQLSLRD